MRGDRVRLMPRRGLQDRSKRGSARKGAKKGAAEYAGSHELGNVAPSAHNYSHFCSCSASTDQLRRHEEMFVTLTSCEMWVPVPTFLSFPHLRVSRGVFRFELFRVLLRSVSQTCFLTEGRHTLLHHRRMQIPGGNLREGLPTFGYEAQLLQGALPIADFRLNV